MNIELINEYAYKMRYWEIDHGEGFLDYYMHDHTDYEDWGNFLIAEGHTKLGNLIIEWLEKDLISKQDQGTLFLNYSGKLKYDDEYECWYFDEDDYEGDWEDLYMKDMKLMAKFILSTPANKECFDDWYAYYLRETQDND